MVEAIAKKARFLRKAVSVLDVRGTVVQERAELAGHRPELRERFACGTARAVAGATTPLELLLPFIAVGGAALLQRGRLDPGEREALTDAALMLGGEMEEILSLDSGHVIAVVRKAGPTPRRFPRRAGIPEKRPLCVSRETSRR